MTDLAPTTEATEATATLYGRHHRRIRGYCLGQLRDGQEADDAMQSTFLYAFSALQRGVAPRNELPWLFTIAHNVCRTRRRSLRRRSRLEAAIDIDSLSDTVGRDDPSREDLDWLGSSLAALPEKQRRAFLLREWQGLSYAEVAARMGLTESAVEAVLFRARRSLAQKLRADRAASLSGLTWILPALRRLGSLSGGTKAAAAALAVGVVAGTAAEPLVHPRGHARPPAPHVVQTPAAVPQATTKAGHAATAMQRPVRKQAPTNATSLFTPRKRSAPPAAAATPDAASTEAPTPVASEPPTSEPEPTRVETTAGSDTQADAPTTPRAAASTPAPPATKPQTSTTDTIDSQVPVPPQVQDILSDLGLPNPSAVTDQLPNLPSPVQPDLPSVDPPTVSVPSVPDVPSVPPTPTLPPIPNPLPDSPTQGTPLQASP